MRIAVSTDGVWTFHERRFGQLQRGDRRTIRAQSPGDADLSADVLLRDRDAEIEPLLIAAERGGIFVGAEVGQALRSPICIVVRFGIREIVVDVSPGNICTLLRMLWLLDD